MNSIFQLQELYTASLKDISSCMIESELMKVKSVFFKEVKKISIELFKKSKNENKKLIGKSINYIKNSFQSEFIQKQDKLLDDKFLMGVDVDVTLPGTFGISSSGSLHPIVQTVYDLNDAFLSLGFEIFDDNEITDEQYAFDNLNFPDNHPARDSMDTYWLEGSDYKRGKDKLCLRPHLTGGSIRYMQNNKPPLKVVYPGRVYRNESTDARHERAFFQYEALIIDKNIPFSSGQVFIKTVLDKVFGRSVDVRMRAGFFPFVEPGFEIDMKCLVCGGTGCSVCKNVGWIEIMPGGVPHPNVLKAAGIDPVEWSGFYVSVGVDRLVMMKYGIDDVRLFHSGDLRFLSQFK